MSIAYRLEFTRIFYLAVKEGFTCCEARLYAALEMEKLGIKK